MPMVPLQQQIPPEHDLLYHEMRAAYEGDPETWRRLTEARRDAIVEYARGRSAYYRRTIPPGAAFEDIPLLTKDLLRAHHEDLLAVDARDPRIYEQKTSGSTGVPLRFYRDRAQTLAESVSSDRFFRWLHDVPFEATIIAVLATTRSEQDFIRWTRLRRAVRAATGRAPLPDPWLLTLPMTDVRPGDLPEYFRRWARLRSYFLVGHSSGIDWVAQQVEDGHVAPPPPPVAIAATSDTLTEHSRMRIERVFGLRLHSRYGSAEVPFLAASMPERIDRYLFNPLLAYVEILRDDGTPARPGEVGTIVLTDLNNRVMPVIRYRQGDLATVSTLDAVGGFAVVESIIGRESELLRFPSGRVLGASGLGQLLFKRHHFAPWVRYYQCAQVGDNAIELRVVWAKEPGDVRERMASVVRDAADPDTEVRVVGVEDVDRLPSGKVWVIRREDASASSTAEPVR